MNTLGHFFQKEMNGESFSDQLREGRLLQITVNRAERSVRLVVEFPQLLDYGELKKLRQVLEGPASPCAWPTAAMISLPPAIPTSS